ncbi:MAG: bifunctional riboflavin kinase/FAD synthetase [Candidatus Omnitrophica bacterium]|nr:bifunctional riboflavin kinase/FAD synthetase [Candidatus Omnitrophota bacterium]MDD5436894.1 bifunctional riboflavin kinase/FAD synthetase [Candidatus Omnitrophota bacterium]
MKVINGLRHLRRQSKGSVVTIGVFDGVHAGHRKIIKEAVAAAKKTGLTSVVITFDPHPSRVLKPGYHAPSLISLRHREKLIEELGPEILLVAKFTKAFSKMPPGEFIRKILAGKLRMRRMCVGENFSFGRGAGGGAGILRRLARMYGYKVAFVKPVKIGGRIVSSSLIRKLTLEGRLADAARLLGRPVSVLGTVVKGSGIARGLGCPTANINPHHEVIPPRGVYAVTARFVREARRAQSNKGKFRGILNIGFRPTFYSSRDEEPTVEVHLFGFKGDLYGRDIEVYFIKKIRDEVKFRSGDALVEQIKRDMAAAQKCFTK